MIIHSNTSLAVNAVFRSDRRNIYFTYRTRQMDRTINYLYLLVLLLRVVERLFTCQGWLMYIIIHRTIKHILITIHISIDLIIIIHHWVRIIIQLIKTNWFILLSILLNILVSTLLDILVSTLLLRLIGLIGLISEWNIAWISEVDWIVENESDDH